MKIRKYSLGQLQANCYFVINKENNCLIIDPGDAGSYILEEIQKSKLKPQAILATHGHFDHLMAAGEIQQSFPNVSFYINNKDFFLLKRLKKTADYFLGYKPVILPIKKIKNLRQIELLEINNFKLQVIVTPGHTPGSVCFYFQKEKILFSGDTLFKNAIGRYDFPYSNKNHLIKSLKKIISLPEDVSVYPGHGEETTIKLAKDFLYQSGFLGD